MVKWRKIVNLSVRQRYAILWTSFCYDTYRWAAFCDELESSAAVPRSLLLRVSIVAARLGLSWLVATVPKSMLPLVVGDATGDVALLEESIILEIPVVDGPACPIANGIPDIVTSIL